MRFGDIYNYAKASIPLAKDIWFFIKLFGIGIMNHETKYLFDV